MLRGEDFGADFCDPYSQPESNSITGTNNFFENNKVFIFILSAGQACAPWNESVALIFCTPRSKRPASESP
jgi:hypothetical protein